MHPSLPETHPRYPFENLCFEGGGVKGVAYCGALRVLEEEGVYPHHVRRVAGTSIGSLFAMLLALGYSSAELVELLRKTDLSQVLQDRRFGWLGAAWNMFRTFGLNPGSRLADFIGQCLVSHGGTADLTFRQLYEQSGRELCVPVCNVTRLETEYCHPKTTPELPVRVAVAMSMALPVLMRPHRITRSFRDSTSSWKEEELYTDGGLLCNFPVHAFDGWWLSMAPEDTFLARLRPSSEAARLTQDAVRFSPPSGATLAFTTFSDLDRDHSSAWAREGGGPPPRPDTALARAQAKLESQNQRRLARSGELERAFGQLTDTLAGLDGDGDGHISRHEVQALFDQGTLSPADAVLLFGTDAQRSRWLPAMARGESVGCFALTERGAGSDPGGLRTQATLRPGGVWTLEGEKIWVTNGGIADVAVVIARTTERTAHARPKLTAFVLERGDGFTTRPSAPKLGLRGASTTAMDLAGLRVTTDRLLGDVGKGYRVAMEVFSRGRVGLAAVCLGAARKLAGMTLERVSGRAAFGRNISEFGMVKDKVARMMAETWAMESMVYLTTGIADAKVPDWSLESAMTKVFASEALSRIATDALLLAGGAGVSQDQPWERMLRDARVYQILQGTHETLRAYIALGGLQGPSRQISEVARAMREPIKGFGLMYDFAMQRARSALGRERVNRAHPSLRREVVMIEEHVLSLARAVDKVLRRHGKDIAEMQFAQRRLADIATDLYAITACVARCTRALERKGESGAQRECDLTSAFANLAQRRIRANLAAFDDNDDELLKSIAARACLDGAYSFEAP